MFHHLPKSLTELSLEESKLVGEVREFSKKLEALKTEYNSILMRGQKILEMKSGIGSLYSLYYKDELSMGYKNLLDGLRWAGNTLNNFSSFFHQNLFDYLNLHNQQTDCLVKFLVKNQKIKSSLNNIERDYNFRKLEKNDEIQEDIIRTNAFVNNYMHHQFKNFYLIKSRFMMLFLSQHLDYQKSSLDEVF